jgi:hypothetical protein
MVDEINESIDIVVQSFDDDYNDDDVDDDTRCSYYDEHQHEERKEENQKTISIIGIPAYRLNARPLYYIQKKDIQLIQQQFKEQNRLLLKTYKSNAMYSCTIDEFQANISTFFTRTNAYSLIEELNETNPNCIQKYLDDLVGKVKTMLGDLLQQRSINSIQYEEMQVQHAKVRLGYLFFLPDTRHVSILIFLLFVTLKFFFVIFRMK